MIGLIMVAIAGQGQAAVTAPAPAEAQRAHPVATETVPTVPAAKVDGPSIVHPGEGLRVRVPAGATYAGSERFKMYGNADTEIHVFVEADAAKKMKRLYWVQFESFLPSIHASYTYGERDTRFDLWGEPAWLTWGPRLSSTPSRAGGDRESVMRILTKAGYSVPTEVLNVRLVRILDDKEGSGRGRKELMLIYSEDLAPTGKAYAELVVDGKITDAFKPLEKPLVDRATSAFSIERV